MQGLLSLCVWSSHESIHTHTHTHTQIFIGAWFIEDHLSVPVGAIVLEANGTLKGALTTGDLVELYTGTDVEEIGTGVITGVGAVVMTGAAIGVVIGAGTLAVTGTEVLTGTGTGDVVKSIEVGYPSFFPDVAELLLALDGSFFLVPTTMAIIAPTAMTRTIKTRTHNRTLYTFVESRHTPECASSLTATDWFVSSFPND